MFRKCQNILGDIYILYRVIGPAALSNFNNEQCSLPSTRAFNFLDASNLIGRNLEAITIIYICTINATALYLKMPVWINTVLQV